MAFAFFFLLMLLFAARGVEDCLASRFGAGSGYMLGTAVFLVYLTYALGTETFAFTRSAAVAGLVFVPLGLAATAERRPPGVWQDFLTIAGIDRKSTRLNSSHVAISYAVFCLKKKKITTHNQ